MNRSQNIIRTSWIGIGANVLLAALKATVGVVAGSIAIVMDAINNLSDALSSVITIIGTVWSQCPADIKHPFGHGRVEYFSGIIIAIIVLTAGATSMIESVKKLFNPTSPDYTAYTLIVIVASIVVKLMLGVFVKCQGKLLNSDALIASGTDAMFDAIITFSTLVSAAIMLIWQVSLDGWLGVIISLFIIKAGWEMLQSPVNELLGGRVSPKLVSQIRSEVSAFEGVHGVHDIILHSYGPNMMIGSLHINVYDTMTATEIHLLTRRITEKLLDQRNIIMTVGIYAIATGNSRQSKTQSIVLQTLKAHKEILQIHGFCYFEDENRVSVDVVPDISVTDERKLAQTLTEELQPLLDGEQITIIIDHNYSA